MKFSEKLKHNTRAQLWDEYCGFLELSMSEYVYIQNRLMMEQIGLWSASGLGKKILDGKTPSTIEEFRRACPLTDYADYAELLLERRGDMLPAEPIIWIQTTWEGGVRPIKLAPYSREMLDTYKHHILSIMMLTTSRSRGDFDLHPKDSVLYGGAPLPYTTGLIPTLLSEDIPLQWLPDSDHHSDLSFSQRIKKGFEMAFKTDIDFFFAIGSVANYMTETFSKKGNGVKRALKISPRIALRYLKAKYVCHRDSRPMMPSDIFHLKGFVACGTDANCYKERIAKSWGCTPIDIAAGTESTCMGTETRAGRGMTFFPDACFYEFIPESEVQKSRLCSGYTPMTCLIDEVIPNTNYEIVISTLKGGAFMRYRIGDMYRCVPPDKRGGVPRFVFIDRVSTVIDIAGFTRITEKSINEVIAMSKLGISSWAAAKEFSPEGTPFMHMYVEIAPDSMANDAVQVQVLTEHLSVYFRNYDSDYKDLKKLLNIEPLQITLLKAGTIERYEARTGHRLERINPSSLDIINLLRAQETITELRPLGEVVTI